MSIAILLMVFYAFALTNLFLVLWNSDLDTGERLLGLFRFVINTAITAGFLIVLRQVGHVLIYHERYNFSDVAFQRMLQIYKQEKLRSVNIEAPKSNRYVGMDADELEDVYSHIDRKRNEQTFAALLWAIKDRVEVQDGKKSRNT